MLVRGLLMSKLSAEKIVELESCSWGSEQSALLVLDRIKVISVEFVCVPFHLEFFSANLFYTLDRVSSCVHNFQHSHCYLLY